MLTSPLIAKLITDVSASRDRSIDPDRYCSAISFFTLTPVQRFTRSQKIDSLPKVFLMKKDFGQKKRIFEDQGEHNSSRLYVPPEVANIHQCVVCQAPWLAVTVDVIILNE